MSSHVTTLNIRGPSSVSTLRVNTSNVLTVSSSIHCQGNIVDANFVGNIVFPEHLQDGVLYIQNGMLKTSNISEYAGGLVLPGNVTGNSVTVEDTFGSELVYIDNDIFRIDGTLYVSGLTPMEGGNVSIEAVGGVRASQFLTASDQRLKTNIQQLSDTQSDRIISAIRSLPIKTWKDQFTGKERTGLVADDVQGVLPEAIQLVRGIVPEGAGLAHFQFSSCSYTRARHGFRNGDRIVYTIPSQSESKEHISVVKVYDEDHFYFCGEYLDAPTIRIKGKMVNDLKSIDYDMILAGVIQTLQKMT